MSSGRSDSSSSVDSLFSERPDPPELRVAASSPPPIDGLYLFKDLVPPDLARNVIDGISRDGFFNTNRDQVMLFAPPPSVDSTSRGLPEYLLTLLHHLEAELRPNLSAETYKTVFDQPLARQIIINLYSPGEGISPHVDLPHRYANGVVGVSLFGSTVMTFSREKVDKGDIERHDLHLPPRSVYILSGPARYDFRHGIEGRDDDLVRRDNGQVESVVREERLSITFRWMKEGGDVLA